MSKFYQDPEFIKAYKRKEIILNEQAGYLYDIWTFMVDIEEVDEMKKQSNLIKEKIIKTIDEICELGDICEERNKNIKKLNEMMNNISNGLF